MDKDSKRKNSIIPIVNSDELCCARALVTLKARAEWKMVEKRVKVEEESQTPDQTLLQELKERVQDLLTDYNTLWMREPGALVHALVKQLKEEPEERSR